MKISKRILALLVLAALVFIFLELPIFWQLIYPLEYKEFILEQAAVNDLDPALVAAVIKVESNFQHDAVSRAQARGVMQIILSTARDINRNMGLGEIDDELLADKLFDPEFNITLGTWYLADLLRVFGGDEAKALAGYNAGRGQVRAWLKDGTWDGTYENREQIPFPETSNYLGKVLLARQKYQQLYDFD